MGRTRALRLRRSSPCNQDHSSLARCHLDRATHRLRCPREDMCHRKAKGAMCRRKAQEAMYHRRARGMYRRRVCHTQYYGWTATGPPAP